MDELKHNKEESKKDEKLVDSLLEEIKKDNEKFEEISEIKEEKEELVEENDLKETKEDIEDSKTFDDKEESKTTENKDKEEVELDLKDTKEDVEDIEPSDDKEETKNTESIGEKKECSCCKKNKHGILYWLLVIFGVAFIMFMSINIGKKIAESIDGKDSSNVNSKEESKDQEDKKEEIKNYDYSNFLNQKSYTSDTSSWTTPATDYYVYDINKDGIDELFVVSFDDGSNFFYTAIYTYLDNQVVLVDNIYTYGRVYGDNVDGGIVYSMFRTTAVQNYYALYKLNGNSLEIDDDISFETGDSRIVVIEPTKLP